MIRHSFRVGGLLAAAALVAACSSSNPTPPPGTPAPTPAATPAATAAATEAATPTTAGTPAAATPTAVTTPTAIPLPTISADVLVTPGHLTFCSDLPYPPMEYWDADGNPTGADIDIATELANRLGLKVLIQNTVFDTIQAALLAGKCDAIISSYDIRPDRQKVQDMYAYFKSGQAFVVAKGNPEGINATTDLCGKSVAVESGTSEYDHLTGTGSVKAADGLSNQCTAGGKGAIDIKPYAHDSDALLALQSAKVSAYFTDLPPAGYYVKQHPDLYEVAPLNLSPVLQAIGVMKDASKASLQAGIKAALNSMITDGTTLQILTKYSLQAGVVTTPNP